MGGTHQHKIIPRYLRNASDSPPCLTDVPNWNREPSLAPFVAPVSFSCIDKMSPKCPLRERSVFNVLAGHYRGNLFPQRYINFTLSTKQEQRTSQNEMFTGAGTDNYLLKCFVLIMFRIIMGKKVRAKLLCVICIATNTVLQLTSMFCGVSYLLVGHSGLIILGFSENNTY